MILQPLILMLYQAYTHSQDDPGAVDFDAVPGVYAQIAVA